LDEIAEDDSDELLSELDADISEPEAELAADDVELTEDSTDVSDDADLDSIEDDFSFEEPVVADEPELESEVSLEESESLDDLDSLDDDWAVDAPEELNTDAELVTEPEAVPESELTSDIAEDDSDELLSELEAEFSEPLESSTSEQVEDSLSDDFGVHDLDLTAAEPEVEAEFDLPEPADDVDSLSAETNDFDTDLDLDNSDELLAELSEGESDFEGLSVSDALAELDSSEQSQESESTDTVLSDSDLPEFGEADALKDAEEHDADSVSTPDDAPSGLSEAFNQNSVTSEELDALVQKNIESAGLDLDNLLTDTGDDWDGFDLSSNAENIPKDESEAWTTESTPEPELEKEDWSEQPEVEYDPHGEDQYLSIEALMAEAESGEKSPTEEEDLNLDVGLDDFPNVLGDVKEFDVDVGGEASSKLDLAKAYLEMSDQEGALELLEEAIQLGDESVKEEVEALLAQIKR
ncbi:hypothetical protein MHO82_22135, partial [Vibrio sp. Of7-15]|uniref:FimV/HubP family polar landmark protein n=1 Tax=Vibrio sp. Of7-15 TaxID=2724879 RepID=UPI0023B82FCD